MQGLEGSEVHQSGLGWEPVSMASASGTDGCYGNLSVLSAGFLVAGADSALVWRGPRKNGLIKQFLAGVHWPPLDYLLVDTPPGTSDEHLSLLQYLAPSGLDGVLLVTTPQRVALLDVRKQIDFCRRVGLRVLGLVENMVSFTCPQCAHTCPIFAPTTGGAASFCAPWPYCDTPDGEQAATRVATSTEHANREGDPPGGQADKSGDGSHGDALGPGRKEGEREGAGAGVSPVGDAWRHPLLLGRLPLDPQLARCSDGGRSVLLDAPDSPIARELTRIAARVRFLCEQDPHPPSHSP